MDNSISISIFRPKGVVKAAVEVVHGMSEHKERYSEFASYLAANGIGVIVYDQLGHGETAKGKQLGHFQDNEGMESLVYYAHEIGNELKKEFPNVPYVLFGHSMGTIVARNYIQKYDNEINGLVLSGAPNKPFGAEAGLVAAKAITVLQGKKKTSPILKNLVTGSFNSKFKNPKTEFDWLSKNEENVQNYINDPLCGFDFSNQAYTDVVTGIIRMSEPMRYQCEKPNLPIYFICGEEDPCTGGKKGLEDSMETLRKAGYSNISKTVYPELRHEILLEKERDSVYQDVVSFIEKNVEIK